MPATFNNYFKTHYRYSSV